MKNKILKHLKENSEVSNKDFEKGSAEKSQFFEFVNNYFNLVIDERCGIELIQKGKKVKIWSHNSIGTSHLETIIPLQELETDLDETFGFHILPKPEKIWIPNHKIRWLSPISPFFKVFSKTLENDGDIKTAFLGALEYSKLRKEKEKFEIVTYSDGIKQVLNDIDAMKRTFFQEITYRKGDLQIALEFTKELNHGCYLTTNSKEITTKIS